MSTTDDDGLEPTEPVAPVPPEAERVAVPRDPNAPDRRAIGFGIGVLVLALVMMIVGGLVSAASDDDDDDEVAAEQTTTTTEAEEETTTSTSEASTTTTALVSTTTSAGVPSTTVAPPACRNSTNRVCGAFRWDPQPGLNERMQVDVTVTPTSPRAGELVTITYTIRDDAAPRLESADYGDGTSAPLADTRCAARPPEGFGPWSPPEARPATVTLTDTHVYGRAGEYRYRNAVNSSSWGDRTPPGDSRRCPRDPYADSVVVEITIPVS